MAQDSRPGLVEVESAPRRAAGRRVPVRMGRRWQLGDAPAGTLAV